jgi:hypothetical protein
VEKIKEELTIEEQEQLDRKQKERTRFQQIMAENEENQQRLREEAERERIEVLHILRRTSRLRKSMLAFRTNWRGSVRKRREKERRKLRQ